jgi:hypothetical protein
MFTKASKFIQRYFFPLAIILLVGILAVQNYEPGTILTGWDSLHPDFNFPLAFKRAVFGVWREDQGLGSIAMHSHMADLPRLALLWLSSFFLKISNIRYFYVFLTLVLGPLGVYSFLSNFIKNKLSALLSAIYYLLNLTTLQHFVVPFEMFLTQYAFLPWLFSFAYRIIENSRKKDILIFFVLSVFAAPMAYAATLFYAYFGSLVLFLFLYVFLLKDKLQRLKRAVLVLVIVFVTNAFWILPNIYAISENSDVVTSSKINSLFSPEAFLRNKDYADIDDFLLQKSYLFSWRAYDFADEKFVDLLSVWNKYFENTLVVFVGYLVSAIALIGIAVSLLKRRKIAITLFGVLLYSLFFLLNSNPPTGVIYTYFFENFPVFTEGFRMPFSKFSIIFLFSLSFFFAFAHKFIFDLVKKKEFPFVLGLGTILLLLFFTKPAFEGNLIAGVVKTKVPEEYQAAFDYLDNRGGRVAKLPIYTPFNWEYHDWGYEGSPWFTWFSMQNAQLDRDFDRFSKFNETFYNQASFAIYSKDLTSFERVLEKYNVSYVLLDMSVINAGGSEDLLYIDELREMLSASKNIKLAQKYGFLEIYETNLATDGAIFAPKSFNEVDVNLTYAETDPVYEDKGRYVIEGEGVMYPFVNFDKRQRPNFEYTGKEIVFETEPLGFSSVKFLAKADLEDESFGQPEVKVNEGKRLVATIPVKDITKEDFGFKRGISEAKNCDIKELGSVFKENIGNKIIYRAEGGGVSCDYLVYEDLSLSRGYILHIKGENKEGRGLKIYLQNRETGRMDLEELLPERKFDEYFFVLPKDIRGEGYTLNLETRSFGDIASENVLEKVEFVPFPYSWLTSIKLVPKNYDIVENDVLIVNQKKVTPTRYEVEIDSRKGGLIVLDQAYEKGWQAFLTDNSLLPFLGKRLEHRKVNSWANGWFVPKGESTITIVYIPQYLEYIGFGMLLIAFMLLFKPSRKRDIVKSGLTSI